MKGGRNVLDALIGILSSIVLLIVYSFLEKRRVQKVGRIAYVFILFVIVASIIAQPSENLLNWVIWSVFFYTVLDDIKTKTVYAPIYVLIIVFLFLLGKPMDSMVFAIAIMGIFLLFVRKTKETFLSLGDVYCLVPLAFWLGSEIFISLLLSLFMAASILPFISLFYKAKYYAFTPFMVLAAICVQSDFHIGWLFVTTLAMNVLVLTILHLKKKK